MKKVFLIILIVIVAWFALRFIIGGSEDTWICDKEKEEWIKHGVPNASIPTEPCGEEKMDLIRINNPRPNQRITSPLVVEGEAVGNWFFEGDFPVVLTDWDGRIIAEGFATAQSDWMTENFVQFKGILEFEKPTYKDNGALILQKDNPSGLPEHDDALEIPIKFESLLPEEIHAIANSSEECSMAGVLTDDYFYNENSKTWWIDLERMPELEKDGCNPACVVNEETKTAEVNWRCTGAIPEIKCEEAQRNVDACIEIYQPVCATVNIQCVTTPCNPITETYSNSCKACSNPLVSSYKDGECK
ncbi:MAG: Gmad2 immunoglobulin-like domain-containing protein [Patescibacteria group bacterium]